MEFWLTLTSGIIVGWLITDTLAKILKEKRTAPNFSKEYFKGLNYIINEEQDKAISVFSQIMDHNPEAIETQVALGALFRRRGESARAIAIHKTLIEDNNLNLIQTNDSLLELGRDYMKAGMLDRAVGPFEELLKSPEHQRSALVFLSQIYDQANEWDKAIEVTNKLSKISEDDKWEIALSHYYCEKAKQNLEQNENEVAKNLLDKALIENPACVRANIDKGKILQVEGNHNQALEVYKKVESQNPIYITDALSYLLTSYHKVARPEEIISYLRGLLKRKPSTTLILALVEIVQEFEGNKAAEDTLVTALQKRPTVRGLKFLIGLNLAKEDNQTNKIRLKSLQDMMAKLQEDKSTYICVNCGFQAQQLHWQCPGCRNWSTIEPIVGVSGE